MIREQHVYPGTEDLAEAAAARIVEILGEALELKSTASLVLTGGRTPRLTYGRLAEHHPNAIDWRRVALFWGDERFVPHDHQESNYGMAAATLLAGIKAGVVLPVPTNRATPDLSAAAYENDILNYFAEREVIFDLTLLGLGDDAHVASLFPGAPELEETERFVVPSRAPVGSSTRERVTMTFRALNASASVLFIVAGDDKREAVRRALAREAEVPAAHIAPRDRVLWYMDAEAAGAAR